MIFDILGWIGMILLLITYILLSSNKLKNGIPYQLLNLIASLFMAIGLLPKNAWFSFALQVVFIIIAIITIITMLNKKSKNNI